MNGATWLVTGANGFVGRHVVRELAADPAIRVVTAGRAAHATIGQIDDFATLDTASIEAWAEAFRRIRPYVVLHMAGRTPPAGWETMVRDNVELTRIILAALERVGRPVRLVHCGSAAELGEVPVECLPVAETFEPNPVTDYGRTKWEASRIVLSSAEPVEPVVGRIFNVIGPGQPANQVFGRYAREFVSSSRIRGEPWVVSGLENRRDFVDVRDAARALIALGFYGKSGSLYHIGTGVSHSVRDGLEILARSSGIDARFVDDSSAAHGPGDSIADIRRIRHDTPWRPLIAFQRSVEDLWRDAVDRIASSHVDESRKV